MTAFFDSLAFFGIIGLANAGLTFLFSAYYVEQFSKIRKWEYWEILAFIAPQMVWASCFAYNSTGKSLTNFCESTPLLLITPVFVGIRGAIGNRWQSRFISSVFILILMFLGYCCYAFTPALPEGSTEPSNIIYNIFQGSLLVIAIASFFVFKRFWQSPT